MTGRRGLLEIASGLLSGRLLGHRGSRCSTTASGVLQYVYLYFILYVPVHPGLFSPTLTYEVFGGKRIKL